MLHQRCCISCCLPIRPHRVSRLISRHSSQRQSQLLRHTLDHGLWLAAACCAMGCAARDGEAIGKRFQGGDLYAVLQAAPCERLPSASGHRGLQRLLALRVRVATPDIDIEEQNFIDVN